MASRISAISVVVTLLISSLAVAIKRFDRTRASIDFQVVSSEIAFIGKNPKPWHGGWLDHLAATIDQLKAVDIDQPTVSDLQMRDDR